MAALSGARPRPNPAHALAALGRSLLEFALPQRCPACGGPARPRTALCAACRIALVRVQEPICARCLLGGGEGPGCRSHPGHSVHAAWVYDERARSFVHAFKFSDRPDLAGYAGLAMARGLPRAARRPDLVVPVPLHPARRRERGFDQAVALAESLARHLPAPTLPDALERVRATRPQSGLPSSARRPGLRGAFRAPRPWRVAGRRVLLVDDVVTTGATIEEARAALVGAGAEVEAAVLAWSGPG